MRRSLLFAGALAALLLSAGCEQEAQANGASCEASAKGFWTSFRAGLLGGDAARLEPMIAFPLQVEGALDDSAGQLGPSEFRARLDSLLAADSGLRETEHSIRQLVVETSVPQDLICSGDRGEFRVGNMLFQRSAGEWRLVKLFVE